MLMIIEAQRGTEVFPTGQMLGLRAMEHNCRASISSRSVSSSPM